VAQPPVLNTLSLFARDMAASLAFYQRLGIAVPEEALQQASVGQAHHVELPMPGGFTLELDSQAVTKAYDPGWKEAASGGARLTIGFHVESRDAVDATYADMTGAGYSSHLAPFDAFWGARYAILEDPDGNQVGIMSPSDPSKQTAPPPF
jgi:uncharacterized glyoxalase superfamily protein PhnB